jgi:hypothetical protein
MRKRLRDQKLHDYRKQNCLCTRCGFLNDRLNRNLCSKCAPIHSKVSSESKKKRKKEDPLYAKKLNLQTKVSLKRYRDKLRQTVVKMYGAACNCCGETEPTFLAIDHVNNDGCEERKLMKTWGTPYYKYLIKLGKSDRYQILCYNCNISKRLKGGICAHKSKI